MIGFIARRFAFSVLPSHRSRCIRIVFSIALSLAMLMIVISIMDYLQSSRFESIRDVRSFDAVVEGSRKDELSNLFPEASVFEYAETDALLGGRAFLIRFIDEDYDGGVRMVTGDSSRVAVPYQVYAESRYNEIAVTYLQEGKSGRTVPKTVNLVPSGVYVTRLGSEFDSTMLFMPLSGLSGNARVVTAVKGIGDEEMKRIKELYPDSVLWKEKEEALYSAFLIEKTMMYAVLSMLFVIILVSQRQNIDIFSLSKEKEMAELRILGMKKSCILISFCMSFMIIAFLGILLGFALEALLIPLTGFCLSRFVYMSAGLSMEVPSFVSYSAALLVLTLVISVLSYRKHCSKDIAEVLYG